MTVLTYAEKMERLRQLGDLQAEMAGKAAHYRTRDISELANRFERASYAAVNARVLMQAALMAERESPDQTRVIAQHLEARAGR